MKRFKELVREGVEPDMPSIAARTYKEKPNKEPMPKLKEQENHTEEKKEMIQSQLHFMKYACEEILEYIEMGGEIEEWYQVKVAKVFAEFEGLHAHMEGESRRLGIKEEVELNEAEKKLFPGTPEYKAKFGTDREKHEAKYGKSNVKKLAPYGYRDKSEYEKAKEQIDEGRPSQQHPLEGHEYHKKSNAELVYIAKDAHKAAEAMKGHNTQAENKYRDQANDSATVRYFRQKSGMPDWYKKKYGHMKEQNDVPASKSLQKAHDDERKKRGLPDPSYYLELMKKKKQEIEDMKKEEVELNEMDKSQPSSSRGAEGVPVGKKAHPVKTDKVESNALKVLQKVLQKQYKKVKEEIKLDEGYYKSQEIERQETERLSKRNDPPFMPDKPKKPSVVVGKKPEGYSTARHLARQALKKQAQKLKPVKESLEESRKTEIVKEIMKKKKNDKENTDTFQKEPVLSSEIVKA